MLSKCESSAALNTRRGFKWQDTMTISLRKTGISRLDGDSNMAHRSMGGGPRRPSNWMCTVCRRNFREPKILNCYHMFCMECLAEHVRRYCRNGMFPCPICMVWIPLPVWGGLDSFETVRTVPQRSSR